MNLSTSEFASHFGVSGNVVLKAFRRDGDYFGYKPEKKGRAYRWPEPEIVQENRLEDLDGRMRALSKSVASVHQKTKEGFAEFKKKLDVDDHNRCLLESKVEMLSEEFALLNKQFILLQSEVLKMTKPGGVLKDMNHKIWYLYKRLLRIESKKTPEAEVADAK